MSNSINKINLSSIQNGFASATASVKKNAQSGAQSVKSGAQRGYTGIKNGAQSVKSGAQSGIANVGARSNAFGTAFTTTVSSFSSRGKALPSGLDGLPKAISAQGHSWKATGAVRNFLGQATQLGITGLKKLTGFGGALVGVFAGLGVGAKAFATYKKPAEQEPATQAEASTSDAGAVPHPASSPDSPASPKASSNVKVNLQVGDAGVKVGLTTQEQKAAA